MNCDYYMGIFLTNNIFEKYYDNECINIYFFYEKYNNVIDYNNTIRNDLNDVFLNYENIKISASYSILFKTFLDVDKNKIIDFNVLLSIFVVIFKFFNEKKRIIQNKEPSLNNKYFIKYDEINISNPLIIRTGVVELYAVSQLEKNVKKCFEKITFEHLENYTNTGSYGVERNKCWIVTHDDYSTTMNAICRLMVNAGFYINLNFDNGYEIFMNFKKQYIDSIKNADYIVTWDFLNCFSLNILHEIKKKKELRFIELFSKNIFIKMFDNKNILFLTPFKDEINNIYESKNIYKLFKTTNLTNINLTLIEAFLTTHPNRKHENFNETLNYYKNKIDEEFLNNNFNVFTCSCGAYGVILCNYVKQKYNILSIYVGHEINYYFGIISKRMHVGSDVNEEYFIKSNLNIKYKNIEKIENNCYGS